MKKIIFFATCFLILSFAKAQIITTVVGTGTQGYSGDGGQATDAELGESVCVSFDISGNLFVVDINNARIRKINTAGIITTIAGNGTAGYTGDGGQATDATLNVPSGVANDALGNFYIADYYNNVIRRVDNTGIITTIAGNGTAGYTGDGGQAINAKLNNPNSIALDKTGSLYIVDQNNNVIRKVNTAGIINTVAGNGYKAGTGVGGFGGDGGQATDAELNRPASVAVDVIGNLYIVDAYNQRIRKVSTSGIISTIAGNGYQASSNSIGGGGGFSGDGGQATNAELSNPTGITIDSTGNLYIADFLNFRIRKVNASGIIITVAGGGNCNTNTPYCGDGGPATEAELNLPDWVALDDMGSLYISDQENFRIRKVTNIATTGISQISGLTSQISLYPNPSNGNINIISTDNIDELKVTDLLGQTVYEAKPMAPVTTLTLENAGVYFVTLTCGKEVSTQKVVVNK